jgi:membrane-bound lytic murein transglycosylase D
VSCSHGGNSVPAAPKTPPAARPDARDKTARLIEQADALLATGVSEQAQGHFNKARESFDRALDLYLGAPGGAYATPGLAEAYRRTLDEIQERERAMLAAGDGSAERLADPASIDEVGEIAVSEEPASEEDRRLAEEAVREEAIDLPVEINDAVLSCIDLYQGRLRDWFAAALARGGRYLPFIRATFASEGIPQDLAYVALVESAFKPAALSRARAKGVWQFISATGKRYGLEQDWWLDERSDPEKATRAAVRYLKELYAEFGDWNLAMAGYNAGEGKVRSAISRYGTRDFWELRQTRGFKRETKNYVPMIHAAIVVANAPAKYGFEIEPESLPQMEAVPVEDAVDLRLLAECADASLEELQALNPELRRLATPAGRSYHVKVPLGSGAAVLECLGKIPPEKRLTLRTHTVARGDTLSRVAQRYGATTREIAEANRISTNKTLSVGMGLVIPVPARARSAAPATTTVARKAPASGQETAPGERIRYVIKPGDTLTGIAEQYRTTVRDLQSWNRLRGSRIAAGDTLTIYTRR